jgi:predicted transcriptional regulator
VALDDKVRLHHDALMRTTVDLPPDLHSVMHSLASSQRRSLSKVAVELMRRGLEAQSAGLAGLAGAAAPTVSPDTGLPLVRFPRIVSSEDVRALDDEA